MRSDSTGEVCDCCKHSDDFHQSVKGSASLQCSIFLFVSISFHYREPEEGVCEEVLYSDYDESSDIVEMVASDNVPYQMHS